MIHSFVHYFPSLVRRYPDVMSAIVLLMSMFSLISKHRCHFIQYIYIDCRLSRKKSMQHHTSKLCLVEGMSASCYSKVDWHCLDLHEITPYLTRYLVVNV